MIKSFKVVGVVLPLFLLFSLKKHVPESTKTPIIAKGELESPNPIEQIWRECGLENILDYNVFSLAIAGQNKIEGLANKDIITIVNFSQASTEKRCYIIDLKNKKLLYHTLVAHGKNSGFNIPDNFSNTPQSQASSIGFFKTAETYYGNHGLSLRIDGLEEGFNSNARRRAVVIHGADYVNENFAKVHGRLGRSWGCPALPKELSEEMIKTIANGTCLFIYGNDNRYLEQSDYIQ